MHKHEIIRKEILKKVSEYYWSKSEYDAQNKNRAVNYAGRIYDDSELKNAVDSALEFWLTEGRYHEEFSTEIEEFLGVEYVALVNSGSSANLVAMSALKSSKLKDRRLKDGDEVITVAAGFPSTVTPIIQNNLIPVFVDIDIPTYNIDCNNIEKAISEKTKCIMIAHTLGNPYNHDAIKNIADKYNLWVIEDNCDAFGSKYNGRYTGTFGDISTISFYPAHHITTGEGGAICTSNDELAQIVRSIRDWGRDCYCAGGENNTCGKRFTQQFGKLPFGFDHKYVYSELGYNLKMTDIQAAIGAAQMEKISSFCEKRRHNYQQWMKIFGKHEEFFILPEPTPNSDPAWFSYILSIRKPKVLRRDKFTADLALQQIETRTLFAGNLIHQPAFENVEYRVADELRNTNYTMENTFFLGTYPGITDERLTYCEGVIDTLLSGL